MPHDYIYSASKEMADDYIKLGKNEKAETLLSALANNSTEYIQWYLSLDTQHFQNSNDACIRHLYFLEDICKTLDTMTDEAGEKIPSAALYSQKFNQLYKAFETRVTNPTQSN